MSARVPERLPDAQWTNTGVGSCETLLVEAVGDIVIQPVGGHRQVQGTPPANTAYRGGAEAVLCPYGRSCERR